MSGLLLLIPMGSGCGGSPTTATASSFIPAPMTPKVLWEVGVTNPADPTYVYTDISWLTNPDTWEAARKQLADIIAP